MKIGLLGCIVSSGNMGCEALALSMLSLLDDCLSDDQDRSYCLFDSGCDAEHLRRISKLTGIELSRLQASSFCDFTRIGGVRSRLRFKRDVMTCDAVIDMTSGDSFTDIYGKRRFLSGTSMKEHVIQMGIPLILGPQTYGPFLNDKYKQRAINVIAMSSLVMTRDPLSKRFLMDEGISNVELTTDVAFELPSDQSIQSDKGAIGLNVSGLLWGVEGSDDGVSIACDYRKLMHELLAWLLSRNCPVKLISHVANDVVAAKDLASSHSGVEVADFCPDPIAIKNQIASCSVFIGSRMHATIASLSRAIPTIPLAYSRKFEGLFDSVSYPSNVDLQALDTEQALRCIIEHLGNIEQMRADALCSSARAHDLCKMTKKLIAEALADINHQRKAAL